MDRKSAGAGRQRDHRHPRPGGGHRAAAWTSTCRITAPDGAVDEITVLCRIDTLDEVDYFRHGGILQYVLRSLLAPADAAGHA